MPKRWERAKRFKLCFRCLGEDHLGQHCSRTRVCGQNGCKDSKEDSPEERNESLKIISGTEGEKRSDEQTA